MLLQAFQVTLLVQKGVGTPFPPHYTPDYTVVHNDFSICLTDSPSGDRLLGINKNK